MNNRHVSDAAWHKDLRVRMLNLGFTIKRLSELSECSYNTVSAAVSNGSVQIDNLERIAGVLKMDVKFVNEYNEYIDDLFYVYRTMRLSSYNLAKLAGVCRNSAYSVFAHKRFNKHVTTDVLERILSVLEIRMVVVPKVEKTSYPTRDELADAACISEYHKRSFTKGWKACRAQMLSQMEEWLDYQLTADNLEGCRDHDKLMSDLKKCFGDEEI